MQGQEMARLRPWTWADQVSTYRFWGLVFVWLCVSFAQLMTRNGVMDSARQLGYQHLAWVMSISAILGVGGGVMLGWLSLRGRTVVSMMALLLVLGVALPLVVNWDEQVTPLSQILSLSASQVLGYAFLLGIPAVLAGGRGGSLAFASAFAVALMIKAGVDLAAVPAVMLLKEKGIELQHQQLSMVAAVIATVLLLPLLHPAARKLFTDAPQERHAPLTPRYRNAWGFALWVGMIYLAVGLQLGQVALDIVRWVVEPQWVWLSVALALVGLLGLVIWVYRLHGEVADLAPSPELLTPRAAAVACVLMPLAALLLPVQLGQVLNHARRAKLSMVWLVFWSLLLPPVAMGMVQNAVNQSSRA